MLKIAFQFGQVKRNRRYALKYSPIITAMTENHAIA